MVVYCVNWLANIKSDMESDFSENCLVKLQAVASFCCGYPFKNPSLNILFLEIVDKRYNHWKTFHDGKKV